jgi:pilus assembly protein CpaC
MDRLGAMAAKRRSGSIAMASASPKYFMGVLSALVLGATLMAAPAFAAEQTGTSPSMIRAEVGATKRLSMGVGKSVIVDLPRDASEIFVGNPKVANAVVRSASKLYVIGLENGQTSIFALDSKGAQIATLEVSIGRDVGELNQVLKAAMPNTHVTSRTVNNTIILTGTVDSAGEAQQAYDIAKGFVPQSAAQDGNAGTVVNAITIRGRDQVMLKITIAEIRRDIAKQLGVTSGTWGALKMDNPTSLNGAKLSDSSISLGGATKNISATLIAYEKYGVSRTLAEPTVTAVSGESAKFTVGGSVPVPAGNSCATDASGRYVCTVGVTYKDYGVTLNFTPVVLAEGRILLRLATEVTEIDQALSVNVSGVNVAGFRTRKHETSVELPSGASIASAGIIQTMSRQVINGLPGLMNLPILGTLFRSRDYLRQETELMIIVTPYIVKPTTATALARPDDGFADPSDPQSIFLGRVNRLYSTTTNPMVMQNFKGKVGFIQD